jgi:hypothetical protein
MSTFEGRRSFQRSKRKMTSHRRGRVTCGATRPEQLQGAASQGRPVYCTKNGPLAVLGLLLRGSCWTKRAILYEKMDENIGRRKCGVEMVNSPTRQLYGRPFLPVSAVFADHNSDHGVLFAVVAVRLHSSVLQGCSTSHQQ